MAKSQERSEAQELNFKRISDERVLRQWEEKNRPEILKSGMETKDEFDKLWEKLTGKPYFQAITVASAPKPFTGKNNTDASDPKSCNYRETRLFKQISWQRTRVKIKRKMTPHYTLFGVDAESGVNRQVFVNLSEERLFAVLGKELAQEIVSSKNNSGEKDINLDLEVQGFWQVMFTPKQDPNDTVDVHLHWEGQVLVIERMKSVILPGFYIEAADNAIRLHYVQTPETSRKVVSHVQMYPYTVQRMSTYEEYVKQKAEGDRITRDAMKKRDEAI